MYFYNCTINNIVDGDTIDCTIDLGFYIKYETRIRLYGIDTPELKDSDPIIRERAMIAKQYLVDTILGKTGTIMTYKKDKYGRFLGTIMVDGININETLIKEGYAREYLP